MAGPTSEPLLPHAPRADGASIPGSGQEACDGKQQIGIGEAGEVVHKVSIGEAFRSITRVAAPFFRKGGMRCWGLAAANLVFIGLETCMFIKITDINKQVQNAAMAKDRDLFFQCMHSLCWWILLLLLAVFVNVLAGGAFSLEWRRFITDRLLHDYVGDTQAFYRLKMQRSDIDNPDQRIAQDVGTFTLTVVTLLMRLIRAVMTILSLSVVLVMVSAKLFWILVLGSIIITVVSVCVFGGPLMRMQRTILAREATLRFSLVRVREHAESIAFYRGSGFERERCMDLFGEVVEVCYRRLFVSTAFQGFQASLAVCLHFLPIMVLAPEYFDGQVTFGTISQASMLFAQLMASMTLIASQLDDISSLGAQAVRVRQLQEGLLDGKPAQDGTCALDLEVGMSMKNPSQPTAIELQEQPPAAAAFNPPGRPREEGAASGNGNGSRAPELEQVCLRLSGIVLLTPRGQNTLITGLSLLLRDGQSLIISGPSGSGKSSLLRAIGGLWAGGSGTIERCHVQDCFFAPQVPYLCMGTLRENSTYPMAASFDCSRESDELIRQALKAVNVGYLADRHGLDSVVGWDDVLSEGEKQRLCLARLMMRTGVRLALLDEATSAMDPENEDLAYARLRERVSCFASVGHKQRLEKFHTHKLTLRPLRSGGCEGEFSEL